MALRFALDRCLIQGITDQQILNLISSLQSLGQEITEQSISSLLSLRTKKAKLFKFEDYHSISGKIDK